MFKYNSTTSLRESPKENNHIGLIRMTKTSCNRNTLSVLTDR